MKIEIFKKKNSFKKKGMAPSPELYWKFGILGAFVVMIVAFLFSYNLFNQIDEQSNTATPSQSMQPEQVEQVRLQKALGYFSDRKTKSAQILSQHSPVVDPSF